MRLPITVLENEFKRVLNGLSFSEAKANLCARIFAENSLDGVYSHGLNRFPAFVRAVKDRLVDAGAEPVRLGSIGNLETWNGNLAPGMYTASLAVERAIVLAGEGGMGGVAVRNTNHWMRGGTYGWQAARAGCIGICMTNTIANMPAWGSVEPRLGNNPLIIAIPREEGIVVLDMAMSQFSYGKLQEYDLDGRELPVPGGYDQHGTLTRNPADIRRSRRPLPIGYWKGAGLSMVLDMMVTLLSGGQTVEDMTRNGKESGLSQLFLCIKPSNIDQVALNSIIEFAQSGVPEKEGGRIFYPGERTLATRHANESEGIPVNEKVWEKVQAL